jgi:lysyl-tRNA synthetase class 2
MTGWWDRDQFARRRPRLVARNAMLAAIRRHFAGAGFVEVETPALQVSPGMEVHLKAFATELEEPFGARRRLYLHTSPEFAMKKLLAAGEPRLFQFARVFRNGERAATHHPEFTMLEWYRADAEWTALAADCEGVLRAALAAVPPALSGGALSWRGAAADPAGAFERLSVADAFARHAGIDLFATAPDPARPDAAVLATAARRIGIATQPQDAWDDVFFKIFLDRIEPKLGLGRPTILHSYPASMAALACIDPRDPRVAERCELYVAGLELANGFGELTDPAEQRRRFEADMAKKQELYGERYPIDEDFLTALGAMPRAAGMALGFDRSTASPCWRPAPSGSRTCCGRRWRTSATRSAIWKINLKERTPGRPPTVACRPHRATIVGGGQNQTLPRVRDSMFMAVGARWFSRPSKGDRQCKLYVMPSPRLWRWGLHFRSPPRSSWRPARRWCRKAFGTSARATAFRRSSCPRSTMRCAPCRAGTR